MRGELHPDIIVATNSTRLIEAVETSLHDSGARIGSVATIEAALGAMLGGAVLSAALLDVDLLGAGLEQVLAGLNAGADRRRFPIVLMCDCEVPGWRDRLAEGLIDDVVPRNLAPFHWRVRLDAVQSAFRARRELERMREAAAARNRDTDPLTGLCRREALVLVLFRETDRVQRMNTPLSLMIFEIDDFEHWRGRLGAAGCDDLILQAVARVQRLLRTYDVFGRMETAEFALCLPGCALVNAVSLAERVRMEVFGVPFQARGSAVRLTASFGIAPSHGRSPLVVVRSAEQALRRAQAAGPESICSSKEERQARASTMDFLAATPAGKVRTTR